jgi:hypothetical protein
MGVQPIYRGVPSAHGSRLKRCAVRVLGWPIREAIDVLRRFNSERHSASLLDNWPVRDYGSNIQSMCSLSITKALFTLPLKVG